MPLLLVVSLKNFVYKILYLLYLLLTNQLILSNIFLFFFFHFEKIIAFCSPYFQYSRNSLKLRTSYWSSNEQVSSRCFKYIGCEFSTLMIFKVSNFGAYCLTSWWNGNNFLVVFSDRNISPVFSLCLFSPPSLSFLLLSILLLL